MTKLENPLLALDQAGIPLLISNLKRALTARGFGIHDDRGPVHGTNELGFTITLPGIRFAISLRANRTAKLMVVEASPSWVTRLEIESDEWKKTPVPYWQIPDGTRRPYREIIALLETYRAAPAGADNRLAFRKKISIEGIIRFVRENHGRTFHTLSRKRPYRLCWEDDQVVFHPLSGTPFYPDLERYVPLYNKTQSLRPSDYPKDLWCNSYFVSMVDALSRAVSPPFTSDDLADDIEAISAASDTERAELIKCRLGQGKFRAALLKLRSKCYVTGIADPRLLRASHIKPWRDSTNAERLDPHNGLLLSPLYDHLFDQGLISFQDDGCMLVSASLGSKTVATLRIQPNFRGSDLGAATRAYLAHHRAKLVASIFAP